MLAPFRIGISDDFRIQAPGRLEPVVARIFGLLPQVEVIYFAPTGADLAGPYVTPADIADLDAVIALSPRFTAQSFSGQDRLAVIARWGVGYDLIDVAACTAADVLLAIAVDAVRRPVAEAIVTLLLALAKQLPAKDRLVRAGAWQQRARIDAYGLTGKVVGSVGLGNIGAEMFRLLQPFGFRRMLAADPYAGPQVAAALGVELVDLETLFAESDFVAVNCLLSEETRGLVGARLLGLMKPTAFFINTARGPIVDQAALLAVLEAGRIAGAGLDVFAEEPLPAGHPLTRLDNVILTPHSLAWTDQLYEDNGISACEGVLAVLRGELPRHPVNRQVAEHAGFQAKLQELAARW